MRKEKKKFFLIFFPKKVLSSEVSNQKSKFFALLFDYESKATKMAVEYLIDPPTTCKITKPQSNFCHKALYFRLGRPICFFFYSVFTVGAV